MVTEEIVYNVCAVFDKTLAELENTKVEKIECNKRHKTVLAELQVCTVILHIHMSSYS